MKKYAPLLLTMTSLALAACADTSMAHLQAPSDVPNFKVDVKASELLVTGSTDADDLKPFMKESLDEMVAHMGGEPIPARVQASLTANTHFRPITILVCMPFAPAAFLTIIALSCSYTDFDVGAKVRLETEAGTFVGEGSSSHVGPGGMDKRDVNEAVWRATVHDALEDALAHAKKEMALKTAARARRGAL